MEVLAEHGIDYVCDWYADEQPLPMRLQGRRMLSMPYTGELNDIPTFIRKNHTAEQFYRFVCDQFDVLYEDGAPGGRVMALALHPFLMAQPYRIRWLDRALAYVTRHPGVWLTTGSEIADWYYAHYYDQAAKWGAALEGAPHTTPRPCPAHGHLPQRGGAPPSPSGASASLSGRCIVVQQPDVLMHNAAVFATIPINRGYIEDIAVEEFDRVMAVNVKGVFLACRALLPYMKQQRYGKIINIASGVVFAGPPGRIHYNASKGAVVAFTRTLAREVGDYNICVNGIAPGSTLSEESPTDDIVAMRNAGVQSRAFKRVQRPDDLLGAAVFLASAASDFITGQTISVDGGSTMR